MTRTLGLDIGIASLGFALVDFEAHDIPVVGVHCFEKAEQPKTGESLALPRRTKRSTRRRLRRRNQRLRHIKNLCMQYGLVRFCDIDALGVVKSACDNPWMLRNRGLSRLLPGAEFARVLLHIAKRRGFRSSKREERETEDGSSDESQKLGEMLSGVQSLQDEWQSQRDRFPTIGAYLSSKPEQRNRGGSYQHVILRKLHEEEVSLLFQKQRELGSSYAEDKFEQEYKFWAFLQRPLRAVDSMVGYCELELRLGNEEKRAPRSAYTTEVFNLLQSLSNLKYETTGGVMRALTPEEIGLAVEQAHEKDLKYATIRRLFSIPSEFRPNLLIAQSTQQKKTVEELEKRSFPAQLSCYRKIRDAVSKVDEYFWEQNKGNIDLLDGIALQLSIYKDESEQESKLIELGVPASISAELVGLPFTKFHGFSIKAMRKLIPLLRSGKNLAEAIKSAGYEPDINYSLRGTQLPPFAPTTNPVVNRALAETRKVVNAIIRHHGLPDRIHVELARDLSRNFKERSQITRENKVREARSTEARQHLAELLGREPRGREMERYLLAQQQAWRCLYSGRPIEQSSIVDDELLQVDHIIPYSLCFDDSMANRVLVYTSENQHKGQRLPWEYFGGDDERWSKFEANVAAMGNDFSLQRKKANLLRKEFGEAAQSEWKNRALNDTRYIAKIVAQHLREHLALGDVGQNNVRTRKGALTAMLRRSWGLAKNRDENDLHHAQDAIMIACAEERLAQQVEWREKRRESGSLRRELRVPPPWGDDGEFRRLVQVKVAGVFVSRRPSRSMTGAAHQDTVRSRRDKGDGSFVVVQKIGLGELKPVDLEKLYQKERNSKLYNLLKERLESHGNDPKKAFGPSADPIVIGYTKQDRQPRIVKAVTIATTEKSGICVGGQGKARKGFAKNGDMVRVDVFSKDRRFYLVPIYASDVCTASLPGKAAPSGLEMDKNFEFCFSLSANDYLVTEDQKGQVKEGYYRGLDISDGRVGLANHAGVGGLLRLGTATLKRFEKYRIDYFGCRYRILKEKRRGLANSRHHQERSPEVQEQTTGVGG